MTQIGLHFDRRKVRMFGVIGGRWRHERQRVGWGICKRRIIDGVGGRGGFEEGSRVDGDSGGYRGVVRGL